MKNPDDNLSDIKVYRFQPCYEVDDTLRAHKIAPDSLWFSTPRNLNDPMDIDHPLDDLMVGKDGDSPVLREMAKVMYPLEQKQSPHKLITDYLLQQIQYWAANGGDSLDICQAFSDRLLQLGVACFTTNWDSPPMWAHYASNWQGFAIEYGIRQMDIAKLNENSAFSQFLVNYCSRIEKTSLSELLFSPCEAMSRIFCTKTLPWSYENEWRLIHLDGGDQVVEMPAGMRMTGIVLGPKSPGEQNKLLAKKCAEWKLDLRRVCVGLDRTLHLCDESVDLWKS